MSLKLNKQLDVQNLREQFQMNQRLRINGVLSEDSAELVLDTLVNRTPWHLVYSDTDGLPIRQTPDELAKLDQQEFAQAVNALHQRASHSYQYTYKFFPLIDEIKSGRLQPGSTLYSIAEFVNSTEFLAFARELTNNPFLVKADPQATLYEAGHFLTTHDDSNYQRSANDPSTREYAIVFGFSKDWPADWGGQTSFFDTTDNPESLSWNPGFNTLSIFKVPTLHCVNYVAPFAAHGRYSITGWLRSDPNIKRPDLGDI